MEITINLPACVTRDLTFAMNFHEFNGEVVERALMRLYAELFNPLTGQQIKD